MRNKKEEKRYIELLALEKTGEISKLQRKVRIPISINGVYICEYIADFTYKDKNGQIVIESVGGDNALKKKLLYAIYGFTIKEV